MSVDIADCHDQGRLLPSRGVWVGNAGKLQASHSTMALTKNSALNRSEVPRGRNPSLILG